MGRSKARPGWLSAAWPGRIHPWSWAASSVSSHIAEGGFNIVSIIRSDSNLSQTSKIQINSNMCPKFMKPDMLFF
jgi:hypothetical protein